jgi:alpha-galactosidase
MGKPRDFMNWPGVIVLCCIVSVISLSGAGAIVDLGGNRMKQSDIPARVYSDFIMASQKEVQQALDWANTAFNGAPSPFVESILGANPPFSFVYDGTPSRELLGKWKRTVETKELGDSVEHQVHWNDPETGLVVTAVVTAFKEYPAVDWVLYLENKGTADTPIIENIQALDADLITPDVKKPVRMYSIQGDTCSESTFVPFDAEIGTDKPYQMTPSEGRSSTDCFPYFDLQYEDQAVIAAIGWTGKWAASIQRNESGLTNVKAGMEKTHLTLHPGERIRSPRILLMTGKGDLTTIHNRFRRLMVFHYVPKIDGKPLKLPVALQCFDRYWRSVPEWSTEAGQIHAAKVAHELGCDTLWLDASWFPDKFPWGVGNWTHNKDEFPNGLKPVSDACHERGLKFLLWFEPERVTLGTQVDKDHPQFVLRRKDVGPDVQRSGLFKLYDPAARKWLTDLLSKLISDYGLDVYRNDFNFDPAPFWRENDAPDRQGMTEIQYIEGLYQMWDDLRAQHPGLWIDNCASGGRRIDLEMSMRSVPLWRSDTGCAANSADWNQIQSYGLSLYVPINTIAGWVPEAYSWRSAATGGFICQWDYLNKDFPMEKAKAAIKEVEENQKYWYGDFYPLTPCSTKLDQFIAYQFHRPDLNGGIMLGFRRKECEASTLVVKPQGLSPDVTYKVEIIDDAWGKQEKTVLGRDLMSGLELTFDKKESSLLVRYSSEF